MDRMRERTPFPRPPANAIVLALVTVVALLVAPVCAPLCAAKACSSGTAQERCHEMGSMSADGSEQFVAAGKACGASDFSAVLVKADEKSSVLQSVRIATAPIRVIGPAERVASLPTASGHRGVNLVPLELRDSLLLTTILRI
jgi:hypothetical protein